MIITKLQCEKAKGVEKDKELKVIYLLIQIIEIFEAFTIILPRAIIFKEKLI